MSLFAVEAAVLTVAFHVVKRHSADAVLTWKLLRTMEAEVLADLTASGQYDLRALATICCPIALAYPSDQREVSLERDQFVPYIFRAIADAWNRQK